MATAHALPSDERFKRAVPFEWGYGSTPRTKKLRDALYWKASVATNKLENAALGLPRVRFRPGVRIDMARARIVTAAFRETAGQPIVLQYARMVEKLCDEMPIFIKMASSSWAIPTAELKRSDGTRKPMCPGCRKRSRREGSPRL